ncbi:MAG TPA: RsmG family class I SAM-dependent methyltransferase [Thermoanaerobaculia bacterium]|nr:RsmG family class I SAM-dependent methyltransferase [Thermoanaerobaculia bacterium]
MTDERLEIYKRELLRWNDKVNLIGPEAKANLEEHIREALQAAEILKAAGEVLDFGSGGGLPAIPMAIASPNARFHLVEADQKKWAFLKHAVRECRLNAVVYGDRLARVLTRLPADLRFSLVTSRAVGSPEEWLPSLAPHMAPDGRAALFEGSADVRPIAHFRKAAEHRLARGYLVTFHVEHA